VAGALTAAANAHQRSAGEPCAAWNSYGSFDATRHKRLATAQAFALAPLFDNPGDRLQKPPAYVRPGEMPEPATRSYSFSELLKELA
jgi:hypothetical protein